MITPLQVSDPELAFGSLKNLPKVEDIPKEFDSYHNKYSEIAEKWFFGQLTELPKVREGLDATLVYRALRSILVSFEPKHEHKISGVGYLISQWCEI